MSVLSTLEAGDNNLFIVFAAHPNLKAFVTHGGLLSTTEAMSLGVPVVGIPLMGDQHINMKQVEEAGWGKLLQFDDVSENTLYEAINEVISNPRFVVCYHNFLGITCLIDSHSQV